MEGGFLFEGRLYCSLIGIHVVEDMLESKEHESMGGCAVGSPLAHVWGLDRSYPYHCPLQDILMGSASFVGPHKVKYGKPGRVDIGGEVTARDIIIATGSVPFVPPGDSPQNVCKVRT